jgi:putative peptide zinc metalloprotease protein
VFMVEPTDVANLYVTTPGRVAEVHAVPGTRVKKGDLLVRLSNEEKLQKRESLDVERQAQQKEVDLYFAMRDHAQEQVARAMLAGMEKQVSDFDHQLSQLEIRAPCDGTVVAPPRVPEPAHDDVTRQLPHWYGTPLDPQNHGCWLTERTPVLSVAPIVDYDAILYIDQGDRDDVREGEPVQIRFEHLPDRTFYGTIEKISKRESEIAPEILSNKANGGLATVTDPHGKERLQSSAYQATVRMQEDVDLLRTGMRGHARVTVAHRSAGAWLWRYLRRTFHFRL